MAMVSVNPATGETIKSYHAWPWERTAQALEEAEAAFRAWRETTFAQRAERMRGAAAVLRRRAGEFARIMALEMGKPVTQGRAEAEKCAWVCEYYAEHAEGFLEDEQVPTGAGRSYVRYAPLGPVLAVMPWNFPFWQVFRFAAPAVMAGNAALLKHASNVCGCALAVEEVFRRAGFPPGLFRTILIPASEVARVIEHPAVRAVTLTGSAAAGAKVAAKAGEVLKKSVLELGGSDPFIVLADADVEEAAAAAARSRTINSGQSCIAAKRFLVEDRAAGPFLEAFQRNMESLVVGDPLDERTEVGPQARRDLLEELQAQVERSVEQGARILTGGRPMDRPGFFYPPTILTDVRPGMAAFDEEVFGPVAAVTVVRDHEEALELANRTCYGLGASIWTRDRHFGEQAARTIQAGAVFVNGIVASDPRLPFGGVKASGYGRELSRHGIREFVNVQTVWVK